MPILSFSTPVSTLPMIGSVFSKRLEKLSIFTLKDLLYHFPHRYTDLSQIHQIHDLKPGEIATIKGTVLSAKNIYTRGGKQIQKAVIADETGTIEATWFNQKFLVDALNKNKEVYLSGKADIYMGKLALTSPEYEPCKEGVAPIHTTGLIPTYHETYGISSKWLRSRISPLIKNLNIIDMSDFLPSNIRMSEGLVGLSEAMTSIHFPKSLNALKISQARLAFDELFLLQLASQKRKYFWKHKKVSHVTKATNIQVENAIGNLPFNLTNAQIKAFNEIRADLEKDTPMNRLVQGDVGSGKTIVAALAMIIVAQNKLKSVLMAPTEILSQQHYETLKKFLSPHQIKVEMITSSTKKSIKSNLANTTADVLVGTQALLHNQLPEDIGLVVVDEQHRFGVEQRAKLLQFSKTPHVLSMTATPIPRTIALSIYGELDLSVIDEMPKGRIPIKTWVVPEVKKEKAYLWIQEQIANKKTQAFVVCPLIDESDNDKLSEVKAVRKEYDRLKNDVFPKLKLSMLHGRLKQAEKQAILEDFRRGNTDILVSTPVIEVGIDIKNASIMLIEGAERFGLAQLHQLRGRVGRGEAESFCLLATTSQDSQNLSRLKAMEENNSGFHLAEIDLKLRGPGEMYGLRQHGFASLKIASFSDQKLVTTTHEQAKKLIRTDPHLSSYPELGKLVDILLGNASIEPN